MASVQTIMTDNIKAQPITLVSSGIAARRHIENSEKAYFWGEWESERRGQREKDIKNENREIVFARTHFQMLIHTIRAPLIKNCGKNEQKRSLKKQKVHSHMQRTMQNITSCEANPIRAGLFIREAFVWMAKTNKKWMNKGSPFQQKTTMDTCTWSAMPSSTSKALTLCSGVKHFWCESFQTVFGPKGPVVYSFGLLRLKNRCFTLWCF